jgi:sporulation protein YlmC with PRC-barrel domain
MADPVSWLQISQGWNVVTSDGVILGTVAQVEGDKQSDIFDGLAVESRQPTQIRYVPGEQASAAGGRRRIEACAASGAPPRPPRATHCRDLAERRQRLSGVARCRTTFHRFAMSRSEAMRVEDASQGVVPYARS